MIDFPLGAGPCQADGCKRLDTDIRAVTIDGTHAVMARVALCPSHGRARPLWAVWANPAGQYPTDGPEAA